MSAPASFFFRVVRFGIGSLFLVPQSAAGEGPNEVPTTWKLEDR
jgi:hypothetical protein